VQVWDASAIPAAEKALRSSGLGLNPVVDGQLIRVPFPPLSEERRQELVKLARQKAESARVSVRAVREEQMHVIKQAEESGELSEDAAELQRKSVQKHVDESIETIRKIVEQKEQEILHI
ncbi:MAG: ribosome recycling factor, partial [Candidatus Kerfeldbacteria bacterium]|nr:ribosome recycling factor [Candidatus Kerfeldbacteria bacterium]